MSDRSPGSAEPAGATAATGTRDALALPATEGKEEKERGALGFLRELPVLIGLAFVLAILIKSFVIQAFYIPSGSMEPTLMPGDRVLVNKVLYHPHRGDIIVFADPNPSGQPDRGIVGGVLHWLSEGLGVARPESEDFIKRVIGLPGETVELRSGKLYVDGILITEPYLRGRPDLRDFPAVTVPKDKLFVLGDNRLNSNDSRFGLGFVPVDRVIGRAFVIMWPPSRVGWLH